MIDPDEYVVAENDTISDVDPTTQVVYLRDGRRLADELAEQLADDALRS